MDPQFIGCTPLHQQLKVEMELDPNTPPQPPQRYPTHPHPFNILLDYNQKWSWRLRWIQDTPETNTLHGNVFI